MRIESESGEMIPEVEDASDLSNWMGVLRRVEPEATENGWLVFDAAPGNYGLRLSNGVLDREETAMVKVPFQVGAGLK